MADFTALKTAIQNAIKQNGNEEITGNLLQDVLLAIVTTLGEGNINNLINSLDAEVTARQQAVSAEAQARQLADSTLQGGINTVSAAITAINNAIGNGCVYAGIATPSSTPASGKVFYLALTAGTYTNYGGLEVSQGINIIKNNGSTWSLDSFLGIDDAPTPSSNNLIKSGGAFDFVMKNGSAFDLTAYNNGTTYADLNAALTALNALPSDFKKGGMSMKFVQSSDNNYVQFRCKTQSFSANPEDWYFEGDDTLVENSEYIKAVTDGAKHLLAWIRVDGGIDWAVGVPKPVKDYVDAEISNILNGSASTDIDGINKIIAFLDDLSTSDTLAELLATKVDKEEGKSLIPTQYIQEIENPEFADVKTDSDGKITEATKKDGGKLFGGDVEVRGEMSAEEVSAENILLNGERLSPAATVNVNSIIEDPEGRLKIETDTESKVISYRKPDGILVENVGIETNHLELTEQGMTEFQQALKDAGFQPGGSGDWSDYISNDGDNPLELDTPKLAKLNIISDTDLTKLSKKSRSDGVYQVNYDVRVQIEYFDDNCNYFKKWALISGQGNSSMDFDKRNIAIDFFDDDVYDEQERYGKGDAFGIKFGKWVSQDSFHCKSYYTDFFRCLCAISYKFGSRIYDSRGFLEDKTWKKALIPIEDIVTSSNGVQIDDISLQIDNGALCYPDGFPVIIYQNGEFYGIFSFQLKKQRKNYHMVKDNVSNIHLDGNITYSTIFGANGNSSNIGWNPQIIEVRNPKDDCLVTKDGDKYDADVNVSQELAGVSYGGSADGYNSETSYIKGDIVSYSGRMFLALKATQGNTPVACTKPSKVFDKATEFWIDITFTNQVRQQILLFSTFIPTLESMRAGESSTEDIKAYIEQHFDVNNIIDYLIHINVLGDGDGLAKNWQWTTWDGVKWYVNPYDMDGVLGANHIGVTTSSPNGTFLGNDYKLPTGWVYNYYKAEIKARWNELCNSGVISASTYIDILNDWIKRVGEDNFTKEYDKWPESPCNRDSKIDTEHWSLNSRTQAGNWSATKTYSIGDVAAFETGETTNGRKVYKSLVNNNLNIPPNTDDNSWEDITYNAEKTYSENEICYYGTYWSKYPFKSKVANNIGNVPLTGFYNKYPYELGHRDNIWRAYKWLVSRISLLNTSINNL